MLSSLCFRDMDTPYYEEETNQINSFMEVTIMKKLMNILMNKHVALFGMGTISYTAWAYTIFKALTGNPIWFYAMMAAFASVFTLIFVMLDVKDLIRDVENLNKEEA